MVVVNVGDDADSDDDDFTRMSTMLNNPPVSSYIIESSDDVTTLLPISIKEDCVSEGYTAPSEGSWLMEVVITSMLFRVIIDISTNVPKAVTIV